MSKQIDRILAQGVIAGLLAPVDEAPEHAPRPWPLTVFTGIGAWFAAIPFAVLLFVMGGGGRSSMLAILCAAVLCGTTALLRSRPPLFLEQLSLAGLVASALVLYFYIAENGSSASAALSMFAVFAAASVIVPQPWLRMLLGAGMGITGIVGIVSMQSLYPFSSMHREWKMWAILEMSVFWCLLSSLTSRQGLSTQIRAGMEAVSLGMSAAIICSPFWVNDAFFFFEVDGWLNRWGHDLPAFMPMQAGASVGVTLSAAALLAWKWAPMRALWFVTLALILGTFAWYIPSLCVLALIGSVALITGRTSTAILCGCMLVWWMGNFYFSLQWPLVNKAMLLAASGCILALTVAFLRPFSPIKPAVPVALPHTRTRAHAIAFLGCAMLTLGIANLSIMQKEAVARAGTTLFVELAPVDPRSLMQGDYMRLTFGINTFPHAESPISALVGTMDERGVWTAERPDNGTPLSSGEIKINLSGTSDHPVFVTDAWFFKEGEANRWQGARFGEFRVKPDGTAVLIGLRGKNLEQL
ncbi:GDYXXLXY domain-containing protein [Massilia sp. S19_KUP03_FR1]|uniref:GDYXXLXY domain-containing protein n=1 Tax=Massilia sp. S19_KUP03_FR1 TaxID=3025503 RepID=UPI002FCD9E6E